MGKAKVLRRKIMLVLTPCRRAALLDLLEGEDLEVLAASSLQEAQKRLRGSISYDLLLVDAELPDGSWRDLLQFILGSKRTCEVIVCSRCGDEQLWAEVFQCGGYDLIAEPYDPQEILRIVRSALDSRHMERFFKHRTAHTA